jgi:hypothetical protein
MPCPAPRNDLRGHFSMLSCIIVWYYMCTRAAAACLSVCHGLPLARARSLPSLALQFNLDLVKYIICERFFATLTRRATVIVQCNFVLYDSVNVPVLKHVSCCVSTKTVTCCTTTNVICRRNRRLPNIVHQLTTIRLAPRFHDIGLLLSGAR